MKAQAVLAIDDSMDIHHQLRARLRSEGVELHHAHSAEEGLAMARRLLPDLILLDVDMPNMTGLEVCRALKSDGATVSIPVIFLSGASAVHDKVRGFDVGAVDYVTKPFEVTELRARVRAALRTKRCHDLLAARAQVDSLTGLWNRGYFTARLEAEIAAARRHGRNVALAMIDVDDFKALNDTHGHPIGDRALEAIGEVLTALVRQTDAPCRYGGEEFAVILTETDDQGALVACERMRAGIEAIALAAGAARVRVSASIGVAATNVLARRGEVSESLLLRAADDALYAAKHDGKNRVRAHGGGGASGFTTISLRPARLA